MESLHQCCLLVYLSTREAEEDGAQGLGLQIGPCHFQGAPSPWWTCIRNNLFCASRWASFRVWQPPPCLHSRCETGGRRGWGYANGAFVCCVCLPLRAFQRKCPPTRSSHSWPAWQVSSRGRVGPVLNSPTFRPSISQVCRQCTCLAPVCAMCVYFGCRRRRRKRTGCNC